MVSLTGRIRRASARLALRGGAATRRVALLPDSVALLTRQWRSAGAAYRPGRSRGLEALKSASNPMRL
jgi:hypothetical protein